MLNTSCIVTAAPNFSEALGVPFPEPPQRETPDAIHAGVVRLRQIRDRREQLRYGLEILHEMLYLVECPESFLSIANLIAKVREELIELGG